MGKELITGFAAGKGFFEWTSLVREKGALSVAMTRRIDDAAATEADAGSAAAPATSLGERVRPAAGEIKGALAICLPADQLLLRVVDLPVVPDDEMPGVVSLQMDKISPFPVEDMVYSHEVLSEAGAVRKVLIAAARSEVADALEKDLHAAGLSPARLDVSSMAWWHLIKMGGAVPEEGRHVAVVITGGQTELIVADHGVPVTFLSMGGPSAEAGWSREVADEVSHTLMAMELEHGSNGPVTASIWAAADEAADLADVMKETCGCRVASHALDSLPPLSEGVARRHAEPGSGRVDLTPAAWRADQKTRVFRRKLLTAAEVLLGIWVVAIGGVLGGTYAMEWSLARLRVRQEEWKQPANEVRDLKARVRMIQKYTEFSHTAIECMREVALLKPAGVKLNSLDYKRGERLKLLGQGDTVNQVYDFKNKLDGSELFKGLDVTMPVGPQFDKKSNKQVFEIDIKLPGGDS